MKVDTFEPDEILRYIRQSLPDSEKVNLNHAEGYADYLWTGWDGPEQAERKQVGELLSDMGLVEDLLRREVQAHPEARLWLIIEGLAMPGVKQLKNGLKSGTWAYRLEKQKGRPVYVPGWFYMTPFEKYEGFLTSLRRQGVLVRETRDYISTAKVLVQMEKSSREPPSAMQRHIKPRVTFNPDSQVMNLLNAPNTGVSVTLAERLVGKKGAFLTVWDMLNAGPEVVAKAVDGVGESKARQIMKSYGRNI